MKRTQLPTPHSVPLSQTALQHPFPTNSKYSSLRVAKGRAREAARRPSTRPLPTSLKQKAEEDLNSPSLGRRWDADLPFKLGIGMMLSCLGGVSHQCPGQHANPLSSKLQPTDHRQPWDVKWERGRGSTDSFPVLHTSPRQQNQQHQHSSPVDSAIVTNAV